jgi:hypothetical protein
MDPGCGDVRFYDFATVTRMMWLLPLGGVELTIGRRSPRQSRYLCFLQATSSLQVATPHTHAGKSQAVQRR